MTTQKPQRRTQEGGNATTGQAGALRIGYWVALTLKPDTAPLRCYVGVVRELDERGVRLTLIDWLTGTADGHDFFAPWDSITSALVATPDDNLEMFGDAARQWQARMVGETEAGQEAARG